MGCACSPRRCSSSTWGPRAPPRRALLRRTYFWPTWPARAWRRGYTAHSYGGAAIAAGSLLTGRPPVRLHLVAPSASTAPRLLSSTDCVPDTTSVAGGGGHAGAVTAGRVGRPSPSDPLDRAASPPHPPRCFLRRASRSCSAVPTASRGDLCLILLKGGSRCSHPDQSRRHRPACACCWSRSRCGADAALAHGPACGGGSAIST